MGTDDIFKQKRAKRTKRRHDQKTPRANSYLIVTEGEKTEPYYFIGLEKLIAARNGGVIDVVDATVKPAIDICGQGCSTGKLIELTDALVKNARINYQNVWVVFDKDDFDDFDQAIKDGEKRAIKLHGAISLLSTGCTCILIIQTQRFIVINGQRKWMRCLSSII